MMTRPKVIIMGVTSSACLRFMPKLIAVVITSSVRDTSRAWPFVSFKSLEGLPARMPTTIRMAITATQVTMIASVIRSL